ncbi:glutathione S-transferase family protein [Xylophilus sp.]|uniref:glutathione S-transferase family protein n=1 Tax=Xylophilus sp. TaxID=2653893 RepID=UPI0013BE478A|nr:glutathione S-transferase family protein [Xylophilus sp.]KAF1045924.1 MAG: Glutathione S-transferase GstB [Xylophilus sp.]
MITLYGITRSRAVRPLWTAEELGIPYELVERHHAGPEIKRPDYLALNPNGKVPTLVDGDLVLFESLAIDLYLAKNHGGGALWAHDAQEEALIFQWTLWAATEAEPPARQWFRHTSFLPPEQRDPAQVQAALDELRSRFAVLEMTLDGRTYLLGERFTVADLNVAAVLQRLALMGGTDYPRALAWHRRCMARPAAMRAFGG